MTLAYDVWATDGFSFGSKSVKFRGRIGGHSVSRDAHSPRKYDRSKNDAFFGPVDTRLFPGEVPNRQSRGDYSPYCENDQELRRGPVPKARVR